MNLSSIGHGGKYPGQQPGPGFYFGLLAVLSVAALVLYEHLWPSSVRVYEPTFLLPILNTILFLAAGVVAYTARRIYLLTGSTSILWVGCGVLTLGLGSVTAGWLLPSFGPDVNVTIFNMGAFLSSLCHMGAVIASPTRDPGEADPSRRRQTVRLGYLAVIIGMGLLVLLTIGGLTPTFFIQGQGPTAIRQNVAGWTLVLFGVSSLFTMNRFRRQGASFFYWYSLALALLAVAILGFFLQPAVGSPIGWVARSAYVLAAVYFLISVSVGLREARTRGADLSQVLAELFGMEQYRALFDNLNDSLAVNELLYDDQGKPCDWRILNVNPAYLRAAGKSRDEVIGRRLTEIYGIGQGPVPFLSHFAQMVETGQPVQIEGYFKPLAMHMLVSAFHLGGSRFATLVTDITARKQAEEALAASRAQFAAIFNSMGDAVIFTDSERRIALANPAAEAMFGYPVAELLGRSTQCLYADPADHERLGRLRYHQGAVAGQPLTSLNYRRKDGTVFPAETMGMPVHDELGHLSGFVGIHRDVTERKLAEEALQQSEARERARAAELEFANRELEAFTYSVSHDLKAPVRAIQGFSRMLAAESASALDEEGQRLLQVIVKNTQTMATLIDDLLALSRTGRQPLKKSTIDLAATARQIFQQLQEQEPDRDLQLNLPAMPKAWGDPSLINQVLLNLLGNGVKYTRAQKTAVIEMGGSVQGQETVYYIKDNGIGFDARYAGKLFGVFQRLHGNPNYEGTGVGLAIVQRIIQRHGGRVWAEGKENEGATFYFALPKNP